jgi:hypothetical protein
MQKWKIATMMLAITVSSGESRIIQTSAAGKKVPNTFPRRG